LIRRPGVVHLLAIIVTLMGSMALAIPASFAQAQPVASLFSAQGTLTARRAGASEWTAVKVGDSFSAGDTIRTGDDGRAALQFVDGALVRLGRLSALTFDDVTPAGNPSVTHTQGKAYFFSRGARREPAIKTKTVNAAIFGTELVIDASDDSTTIDVLHGSVQAFNSKGTVSLSPGERAVAKLGEAPTKSILVRPADAVQWMINFPFVLVRSDLLSSPDPGCNATCIASVEKVLDSVSKGSSLLDALERDGKALKGTTRGALLQAVALWRVGDPTGAAAALSMAKNRSGATDEALYEVISGFSSLVRGNPQAAASSVQAALKARPDMVNAALLESYVFQSTGDLQDALAVIEAAKNAHPQVAQLYDREGELLLSFNKYAEAADVLDERRRHFGSSAMNSILAGFAAIVDKDFEGAQADFVQAQREDPSQSLAYLGQALVKVNDNEYDDAQGLLSKAIQLDPSIASYRAYLGKLFFDTEHSDKARQEYNAAIELDKNDPTAYLYRSFVDVAQNDVIGGLADVEHSIKLNNNRAVYRSTLLLDRDLAVRGAQLSRVYTELGFDQIARVEAVRSINDDYTNYSAHRLLSGAYDSIVDENAKVSEERIANLLSPLSFNIFNGLGESAALGDYNALFDKKEDREALSALWIDNRNQAGGSVLATGKSDRWGYLFKYAPFYQNGSYYDDNIRFNNHYSENKIRGAVQYEPSRDDRLILDGNFNSYTLNNSNETDQDESYNAHVGNVSLGYNHRFSTEMTLLAQLTYDRASDHSSYPNYARENDFFFPEHPSYLINAPLVVQEQPTNRTDIGAVTSQLLYNSTYVDSVAGFQALYADPSRSEYSPVQQIDLCEIYPPEECHRAADGTLQTNSDTNLTSGSIYEYLSLKIPQKANLTLGFSVDSVQIDATEVPPFDDDTERENRFNPKIGLLTTPFSWLTTRAAYFETLSKSVLEDQSSLEPTLVGGLNQDFNDISGARSQNYAFGLDAKYPNIFYVGAQYTHRNIYEPYGDPNQITSTTGSDVFIVDVIDDGFTADYSTSQFLRSYLYGVLTESTVLTAESLINWYDLDQSGGENGYLDTRRYRFGAKQYAGQHFSFLVQGTYRDQSTANIQMPGSNMNFETGDPFWLVDAGVSYRFAEQHGNLFFRVDNIFDQDFNYIQFGGIEPLILEGRSFVLGFNYNFF